MPLVVIRQLKGQRPVTHCIIMESPDLQVDNQCHYMESKAEQSIRTFQEDYVEFRDAVFYNDYIHPLNVK